MDIPAQPRPKEASIWRLWAFWGSLLIATLAMAANSLIVSDGTGSMYGRAFWVKPWGQVAVGAVIEGCLSDPEFAYALEREYASKHERCHFLKRVVATPGQTVAVMPDGVIVDGQRIPDSKPKEHDRQGRVARWWPGGSVPDGYAFVLGDARADSFDSRYYGPVRVERVLGEF